MQLAKKDILSSFIRISDALRISFRFGTSKKFFNLLKCYYEYFISKEKLLSFPFVATVEPTNTCNIRCPYCHTGHGEPGRRPEHMSLENFKKIVDGVGSYLYLINLFLFGEPFLNPEILAMVSYAKNHKIPSLIHTNFNIDINEKLALEIVKSGLAYLSISIDGVTQETYRQYRVGGNLDLVSHNIDLLMDMKKKLRSKEPIIMWQYLLFKNNEHEVERAAILARQKNMRFRVIAPDCPTDKRSRRACYPHPFVRRGRCKFPWTTVTIASNSIVIPCCQAYYPKYELGKINSNNFNKFWNNRLCLNMRRSAKNKHVDRDDDFSLLCYYCRNNSYWEYRRNSQRII